MTSSKAIGKSYHKILSFHYKPENNCKNEKAHYLYLRGNYDSMKHELQSVACFEIFNKSCSNEYWEKFKETINGLVKVYHSTKVDSQKKQSFVDEKTNVIKN